MPGGHITDRQVRRFMDERKEGSSQAIASARAGFSESTARRIEKGRRILASQRLPRQYRTRVDPFQDVWRAEIVPILERAPGIRGLSGILCARRVSSLADEPFAEDDGELHLSFEPLARRSFPFLGRVVQDQI
jgi:hypothetical protein